MIDTANTTQTRAVAAWRSADALALDERAMRRILDGEMAFLSSFSGDGGAAEEGYKVVDGVAVIYIEGALMCGSGWWWDGYDTVAARVEHAHANTAARAVMLAITSPGGMVAGMFDCMRSLRASKASSGKRMVAWIGSAALSAAFGIASTCDEIVVDELAAVGSIGVIDTMVSRAKGLADEGIDARVISSGAEKTDGHPYVPITDGAEARKRARVDALAQAFAREINAGRASLSPADALALDGGTRYGRDAVAANLADRIGTKPALLAELSASKPTTLSGPRGAASTTKDSAMLNQKIASLIASKTGETDLERQFGALNSMFDQAAKAAEYSAELTTLRAARAAEEAAAERAQKATAFEAAVGTGLAAGKLTPAMAETWRAQFGAGEVTTKVLEGHLSAAPVIPALSEAHRNVRAPATPLPAGASTIAAQLLAKPYGSLSWDQRNTLASADPEAHARVFNAWVEAGRPKA